MFRVLGYAGFLKEYELADLLNMKYELYISPENAYGTEVREGVWNGMIQEVINGNATLGMGAISITSEREKVIDFSLGVMTTGVNMLISKPKEHSSIFQFMKPFSLELWMAIVGASFVVSVLYFILDYNDVERQFTLKETLWFSIGTLLMRGTDFSPKRTAQRIVTAGFTFFVLITVSTYTANLAAFLTTTNLDQPISTLDELADRDEMNAGTLDNSATLRFLKDSNKASYRKIWEKVIESKGLFKNSEEGRQRAEEGNFAFIYDYRINSYFEKIHCKNKMVGTPVRLQQHGIVMKAAFQWWDNKQVCNLKELGKSSVQVEFAIKHMAGVFVVGGFGLACSVSFFLFKKFYTLSQTQGKDKDKDTKPEKKLLDNPENSEKGTTILQSV
ncbi:hypothetical protein KUTeg_023331 [Tegillarca granosa]|uniref:Ionotropic glutamate receptor C-terminal domain-containing protein n=1 Tax=Tegillarca granosa TaxID=220873 RepID=A0ABQ9E1B7_TEGGR|nr:hypothetical protein KUTeg_023331 [Tegillarca granosa]